MHCLDARFGWWDDRETALGKARTYTDKALELLDLGQYIRRYINWDIRQRFSHPLR